MNVISNQDEPQDDDFFIPDLQTRNNAYKSLYNSGMVANQVKTWLADFRPRHLDADEVIQTAMILLDNILLSGKFNLRGNVKVSTFFLGICRNIIRSGARKVSRVEFKPGFTDADFASADQVADQLVLIEQDDLELERDERVRAALKLITEKCQEALHLYYYEGKSMAQVALARALANADQAKKAVHRCREQLQNELLNDKILQQLITQLES
jgi:RNA polymerase sigma factor (sigma-70 family)